MISNRREDFEKIFTYSKKQSIFKGLSDNEILSILHCVNRNNNFQRTRFLYFQGRRFYRCNGACDIRLCSLLFRKTFGDIVIFCPNVIPVIFLENHMQQARGAVLNISVVADGYCEIIFFIQRLLVTCPTACEHHQKLIRNLVSVLANKILILNDKITHTLASERPGINYYRICQQSRPDSPPYPLIFPLTGSSWQIIFALTVRQCLRRYQSYKKKDL